MLNITFTANGWTDYLHFQEKDKRTLKKINALIKDIQRNPDEQGIGKAEKLCHELSGFCSRRINLEHRMVYKIENKTLVIFNLRYHY